MRGSVYWNVWFLYVTNLLYVSGKLEVDNKNKIDIGKK